MFAQRRNRLTTHFSERIPVVKRRVSISVYTRTAVSSDDKQYSVIHPLYLAFYLMLTQPGPKHVADVFYVYGSVHHIIL